MHYFLWLKAAKTDIAIRKYPIGQASFFQEEKLQFLEDTKIGPTIITLLPRINFSRALPKHCFVGKKCHNPFKCFIIFGSYLE